MKKSGHTWLFSFTDVAFLLLLVYTQFGRLNAESKPVAEMRLPIPAVAKSSELLPRGAEHDYRQLLIDKHADKSFMLAHIVGGIEVTRSEPMNLAELERDLTALRKEAAMQPRPVVVPLPESYSSEMLQASAMVSKIWSEGANAAVTPAGGNP